jgi:PTS system cellobiose-specific IIC component
MPNVFFDFIEQKSAPIASKVSAQPHISAIRDGFIGAIPFMILGSFLLVFAFPPFAAGSELSAIFAEPFWSFFIVLGGSGATFALVLLYLRSIGRLSFVPAIFNINEPVIFGSPIMMNPVLFIPFVGIPMVNATIAYTAASTNLIGKVVSLVPWTAPAPFGASWSAGWQVSNGLLALFLIILDLVLYYPFFKQLVAQEEAEAREAQ